MGSGNNLPLGNPLLQVVHLPVQHEELQSVVRLCTSFSCQILEACIKFVHLSNPHGNCLLFGMFIGNKLSGCLSKLPDGFGVVIYSALQGAMLLHQILCAEFILSSVLDHHVELLLTHPRLSLVGVKEELLDPLVDEELLFPCLQHLRETLPLFGQQAQVSVKLICLRVTLIDHLLSCLHHATDPWLMVCNLCLHHLDLLQQQGDLTQGVAKLLAARLCHLLISPRDLILHVPLELESLLLLHQLLLSCLNRGFDGGKLGSNLFLLLFPLLNFVRLNCLKALSLVVQLAQLLALHSELCLDQLLLLHHDLHTGQVLEDFSRFSLDLSLNVPGERVNVVT